MKTKIRNDLSKWCDFVAMPDVDCGFWCDPVVCVGGKDSARTVFVYEENNLIAVLPFQYTESTVPFMLGLWRIGAAHARMMKLGDYEFPILAGYERKILFDEVVAELNKKRMCDLVMADNWPEPGRDSRNVQTTYLIDMPMDFDVWMQSLSANTRQLLRRRKRRLEKELNNVEVKRFTAENEMALLHEYIMVVWRASWHGRLGRQSPPSVDFLRMLARNGWVRSYVMFAGDKPIASVQGYQYNGAFMDEAPAYDDAWKKYSPGLVLNYYIVEDLFKRDMPRVVDFGFGYNQYKEMLGNRAEVRGQLWVGMSFRGRTIIFIGKICDVAFKIGKSIIGKIGMDKKIKAKVQRKN